MKRIIPAIIIFFLTGCAMGQLAWTPEQRQQITSRVYAVSYNTAFDKILNRLKEKGAPVSSADRENGIIITDWMSMGAVMFGTGKQKVNMNFLKLDERSTKISLYIHLEGYSDTIGMAMTDDLIDEKHYAEIFKGIDELLYTETDISSYDAAVSDANRRLAR